MSHNLTIYPLTPEYFQRVIALGNEVHGDGYLTDEMIEKIYNKSLLNDINCSFVMLDQDRVIGFRLTYAPTKWEMDEWCSPDLWKLPIEQLCYFKSSTVDSDYRGKGVAKTMLQAAMSAAKDQGAKAGICHTWMQSPGNAAYKYFIGCGGKLLKTYPDRWLEDSYAGYRCVACLPEKYCHCDAGEMILYFAQG